MTSSKKREWRKPVINVRNAKPFKATFFDKEYWINGSPDRLSSYKATPVDKPYVTVTDPETGALFFLRIDTTGTFRGMAVKVCNTSMSEEEKCDTLTLHSWVENEWTEDRPFVFSCERCGREV